MINKDRFWCFLKTSLHSSVLYVILMLVGILVFSACASNYNLQKRRYTKGYYFSGLTKTKTKDQIVVAQKSQNQATPWPKLESNTVETVVVPATIRRLDNEVSDNLNSNFVKTKSVSNGQVHKEFKSNQFFKENKLVKSMNFSKNNMLHKKGPIEAILIGFGSTLVFYLVYELIFLLLATLSPSAIITVALSIALFVISIIVFSHVF